MVLRLPIFLTILLLPVIMRAQSASRFFPAQGNDNYVDERIFFGALAGGVNFSQVDGDDRSGYHKVGINAGAIVYARIRPVIGASLELRFSQKGVVSKGFVGTASGNSVVERYKIKLNYAEVPVMLHYFSPGRLSYSAGIAYSYLISSNEEVETSYVVNLNQEDYPFIKQEISGLIGGNYVIAKHWSLEGRFQYSLTSIRKAEHILPGFNTGSGKELNNMISFRLQYVF